MNNLRKITLLFGSLVVFLASCVKEDPVTVEFKSSEYQLAVGQTLNLAKELAVSNSAEKPVFTVSDEAVASVDAEGLLRALAAGEATVTAGVEGVAATSRIVVSAGIKADSLKLYAPQKLMAGGVAGTVKAEVSPKDYDLKNLEWTFTAAPETFTFQKDSVSAAEFRLTFPTYIEGGKVTVKVTDRISGLSKSAEVVVTEKPIGAEKVTLTCVESLTAMEGLWTSVTAAVEPSGYDPKHLVWDFKPSSESLTCKTEKVSDSEYKVSFLNYVENGSLTVMVTDTVSQVFGQCVIKVLEFPKNGVNSISVSPATLQLYEGDKSAELTVTHDPVFYDPALLEWNTSDEKVVTVDDGVVTVVGLGKAEVTVKDIVSNKKAVCEVTVSEPVKDAVIKSIVLDHTSLKMKVGEETVQLVATCYDESKKVVENYTELVWEASVMTVEDENGSREVTVVEVSDRGIVTPKNAGFCVVSVADKNNGAVRATCEVYVEAADVLAEKVTIDPQVLNLKVGQSESLKALTEPAGVPVSFESSDKEVATVDGNGRVTAVGNGEATITATARGGKYATCKVIVADTWVKLSETEITLVQGKTKVLKATIEPGNQAGQISWKSSDEKIATVAQDGTVTAIAKGTAAITASAADCESAECKVIVEETAVEFDIDLSPTDLELPQDKTASLIATYTRFDGKPYAPADKSWWSSDESIAVVDDKGNVTAKYEGILGESECKTVTIYHSADWEQEEMIVKVVKALPEQVCFTSLPENCTMTHGEVFQLKAKVLPDKASQKVTWRMDAFVGDNARIDQAGNLTALLPGRTIVWAHASDSRASVMASVEINILPIPVESFTITGNSNLDIKVGDALYLETQILPSNASYKTITWSVSQEGVVSVNADGKVTALAAGEVVVNGTLSDGKSVSYNIKVSEASTLQVGDYYYSDGTVSSELDESKTVVGVVFSTQNPRLQDSGLPASCVNGLAVALEDAAQNIKWQGSSGLVSSDLSDLEKYCGYSNTNILKKYNETAENNIVNVVAYLPSEKPGANTSSWYVPSYAELLQIKSNIEVLQARIEAAGGTRMFDTWAGNYDATFVNYWSSTENDLSSAYAVHMSPNSGGVHNKQKSQATNRVRYVFAF
ncbi:MAG: Ig-like domain-containing protein [Bacteroidales bacterium]|nr:Ig-like domain-containing protein [Bacteroidales bacterium]